MTDTTKAWPLYTSHKQVRALKIAKVGESEDTKFPLGRVATFEDKAYPDLWLEPEFVLRHSPKDGGYLVQYLDEAGKPNYMSFSPGPEFERGYTTTRERDPVTGALPGVDPFVEIAHTISMIFAYGGFIPETPAERYLQELLKKTGYFYETTEAAAQGSIKLYDFLPDMTGQQSINGSVPPKDA